MKILILDGCICSPDEKEIWNKGPEKLYINIDKITCMKQIELSNMYNDIEYNTQLLLDGESVCVKQTIQEINEKIIHWSISVKPMDY